MIKNMELDKGIKGRRAIRKYKEKDIPDSVIEELLDLARYAPSSMNGQPWHFIVVKNDDTKKQLVEIKNKYCPPEKQDYKADFLLDAPVIIVICVDKQKSYGREVENGILAAANLMLGAHSRGLGSVYMTAYNTNEPRISEEIRRILTITENFDPITIIPLGYPDEIPQPKELQPLEEIIHYERF
jgi:nitroreductase